MAVLGPDEGNPLRYTGREDDGTGLYYYRARYYDAISKQWISEDPIGLISGINQRGYVGANPISFNDPSGQISPPVVVGAVIGAVVGAGSAYQQCQPIWAGVLTGLAVGATAGLVLPAAPTVVIGIIAAGGADLAMSGISGQSPNWTNTVTNAFLGGVGAAAGVGMTAIGVPLWWSTGVTGALTGVMQLFQNAAGSQKGCPCPTK